VDDHEDYDKARQFPWECGRSVETAIGNMCSLSAIEAATTSNSPHGISSGCCGLSRSSLWLKQTSRKPSVIT
jgi:hypothetical protein